MATYMLQANHMKFPAILGKHPDSRPGSEA
jgi:hypothetical protein